MNEVQAKSCECYVYRAQKTSLLFPYGSKQRRWACINPGMERNSTVGVGSLRLNATTPDMYRDATPKSVPRKSSKVSSGTHRTSGCAAGAMRALREASLGRTTRARQPKPSHACATSAASKRFQERGRVWSWGRHDDPIDKSLGRQRLLAGTSRWSRTTSPLPVNARPGELSFAAQVGVLSRRFQRTTSKRATACRNVEDGLGTDIDCYSRIAEHVLWYRDGISTGRKAYRGRCEMGRLFRAVRRVQERFAELT